MAVRARIETELPGARFHHLRYYCASVLVGAGLSVKQVQEVLGHASAVERLEVCADLWPADHDRARAAMRIGGGQFREIDAGRSR